MAKLIKEMNKEIEKYQGRIYYLEECLDQYGNKKPPRIKPADWIFNTSCYDHCSFELHHIIKFTHYEQNKNWYKEQGLENCLILIRKLMHQHLENPIHELSGEDFYKKYLIHKWELLFDRKNYHQNLFPKQLKEITNNNILCEVWL